MPQPAIETFFDPETYSFTHLLLDPDSDACAVIDSVLNYDPASGRTATHSADRLLERINQLGRRLEWILETHVHADHLTAAPYLKSQAGGKIGIGRRVCEVQQVFSRLFNCEQAVHCDGQQFDHLFAEGETFQVGQLSVSVMYTPGHTPACVSYRVGDQAVFVGDTLFMPDFGTARCDFPGGSAQTLFQSIQRLYALPESMAIYLCHDYLTETRSEYQYLTSVAEQKKHNIHVQARTTEAEFIALRRARDATLEMPRLLLPAVQVNMRGGHFPAPETNGVSYLKMPLNQF